MKVFMFFSVLFLCVSGLLLIPLAYVIDHYGPESKKVRIVGACAISSGIIADILALCALFSCLFV